MSEFDLKEIMPGLGQVRFPGKRVTMSPQGLAQTLLADYTLRTRARFPAGALVELLTEFGATPGAARTTLSRLAQRGVLERRRQGRHSSYRFTEPAAVAIAIGGMVIASIPQQAEAWAGSWTLIAFSLPEGGDTRRRALRSRLRTLGYAPLYDALWVSPHPPNQETTLALAEIGPGRTTVFRARQIDLDRNSTTRDPLEAWDLVGVAREYESFLRRWSPLLPQIRAQGIQGAEALRVRTEAMDVYRRFIALDPFVPLSMMPPGWPRERAREIFETVYDGLAQPALEHVLEVVSRAGEDSLPGIGSHTLADLLGGLLPECHCFAPWKGRAVD
ncbi:MAG: PaaX family transcriptional regulator [Actinomycetota bacterium]|nr:PaaX family transcriptional regulator [Actinomycetota bacterium]